MRHLLAAAMLFVGGTASAALIDFEDQPNGDLGTNTLVYPEATFTSSAGLFIQSENNLCPFNAARFDCEEDLNVLFTNPVNNLSFTTATWNSGDQITVDVYDSGGLLASLPGLSATGNSLIDLSAYNNVVEIDILFTGTGGNGFGYDNFQFNVVPIPAAAWLFGSALGALGWMRRRKAA